MNLCRVPKRVFGKISEYIHASGSIIITGANAPFYESLRDNLLGSINRFEPDANVIIWDLGLTHTQLAELENIKLRHQGNVTICHFPEHELPAHYSMGRWNYAFKSYCLSQSLPLIETRYAFWLDAGCGIAGKLNAERNMLNLYGYYSPFSSTSIRQLTHSSIMDHFMVEETGIASKQMLSGGVQGWNMRDAKAISLLCDWINLIRAEENIAPVGANLSNHRFDQSLLSILYYSRYKNQPYMCHFIYNIRIHLNK